MKTVPAIALFFVLHLCCHAWAADPPLPKAAEAGEARQVNVLPEIKELPDPFLMANGVRVQTLADWKRRREEIKALLLHYEFGRMPPAPGNVTAEESASREILGGTAVERHVRLSFGPNHRLKLHVVLTMPKGAGPFPAIVRNCGETQISKTPPAIVATVVGRGYLLAEYLRTDLQPDDTSDVGLARAAYPDYDWGTLAVWAWGGMRVIDYLLTLPEVDRKKIAVTGHSRGGKTALLTSALDERVTLSVPNAGGGGGFQCWRFPLAATDVAGRARHESLPMMAEVRTYWFHRRLLDFAAKPAGLPLDQHFLAALVAPRPLCAIECMDDLYCTPLCVQRSYQAAAVVYQWLGVGDKLGVYFRQKGGHQQGPEDWATLLDFADLTFCGKHPPKSRKFDTLPYPDAQPAFFWQAPPKP